MAESRPRQQPDMRRRRRSTGSRTGCVAGESSRLPLWITGKPGRVRKSDSEGRAFRTRTPNRSGNKGRRGRVEDVEPTEASVNVHYLHASDGVHLVVDRTGHRARRAGEMRAGAIAFAREMMAQLPHYPRWDEWSVFVYDQAGECDRVPFSEARDVPVTRAPGPAARTPGRRAARSRSTRRDSGRGDRAPAAARSRRPAPADRDKASRHDPAHP